ncbi:unnamed protein product [Schistosoma curassoni]|uniref:Kinetochore protein Spc24 n=1 Tax=Schistosoma curassoni TaxID=6186 RepID=A0A183K335_9TREM|nr:unnamed protein product [Schistosoma curassoni]
METGQTALQSFNIAFLQHTGKLSEFKITLNNRFQTLQDLLKEEQQTITKYNWKGTREALTSTCQEVLCRKKHHHKEWMSVENWRTTTTKQKNTIIYKQLSTKDTQCLLIVYHQ